MEQNSNKHDPLSCKTKLLIFSGYIILTLILTYPLIIRINTHFASSNFDLYQHLNNYWWLYNSLFKLHVNPYFHNYLHYPDGATLLFHTFNPFNGLLTIPFQFFDLFTAGFNFVVVFSYVFSGWGMFLLLYYLTGNLFSSFTGGVIFTFCPFHLAHGSGFMQLLAAEWVPFYLLHFFMLLEKPSLRESLKCTFFLILVTACDFYYLTFLFMFCSIYICYILIKNSEEILEKRTLVFLGLSVFLFLSILSPLFIAMISGFLQKLTVGGHLSIHCSADFLAFFIPGMTSPLSALTKPIWSRFDGNTQANTFLGYMLLFLFIISFKVVPSEKRKIWLLTAFIFFILSLGPYLHVAGFYGFLTDGTLANKLGVGNILKKIHYPFTWIGFPLPYLLVEKFIPLFSFMGVPDRFTFMVVVSLVVLASFTLAEFDKRGFNSWIYKLLLLIFILFEYSFLPYFSTPAQVPDFYYKIQKDTEDYVVLDANEPVNLYYQTIHHKRIIGGYISRATVAGLKFLKQTPVLSSVYYSEPLLPEMPPEKKHEFIVATLRNLEIKYLIIPEHEGKYFLPTSGGYLGYKIIEEEFGLPLIYKNQGIKAFLVP